jgi:phospholipid/cholesterol/gamma-HCH transport system substrate-binding protein
MKRNAIETVMAAVVLVVAAMFLFFAYTTSHVGVVSGYEVTANFLRVEGLRDGGDVRVSGIRVGTIILQRLDLNTFDAVVRVSIDPSVKLPVDSYPRSRPTGCSATTICRSSPATRRR